MKIKKIILLILSLIFILTVFSGCQSNSLIELKVQKGDKYKITETVNQNISLTASGQKIDMNQKLTTDYSYNISDVDKNGTATITVKYNSLSHKQSSSNNLVNLIYIVWSPVPDWSCHICVWCSFAHI